MEKYNEKEKQTVDLTREFFKQTGFWRKSTEEQEQIMNQYIKQLGQLWGIKLNTVVCDFEADEDMLQATGGGEFHPVGEDYVFELYRPSLMTALHIFKLLLTKQQQDYFRYQNIQQDAVEWSHTVFKAALPKLYESSKVRGLFFVEAQGIYFMV